MNKNVTELGQLRKVISKLELLKDDTEITFEFLMTAFFPSIWQNIQEEMRRQYTLGYIEGQQEVKNEQDSLKGND